jgi:simple sugar transport system permease protein
MKNMALAVSTSDVERRWSFVKSVRAALLRPELTALIGTAVVFAYFSITVGSSGFLTVGGVQNFLTVGAEIGIIATAVTLLLVAGEFDLSVGVVVGTTGVAAAYVVVVLGWPFWAGILVGLALATLIGAINGIFIVIMGFPSFLVTLAMMFVLQGASLGVLPVSVVWWIVLALLAAYVLNRTRFGNWIYAAGGDRAAAEKMGVPVGRVKILLFIFTSISAFIVSLLAMFVINQADVTQGTGKEFEAITAAVIGGAAMSGGLGSPIGSFLGALLIGIVSQGFFYTNIPNNWYYAFVGAVLMGAVIVNKYSRRAAMRTSARG